jgi:hypothetical protein
LTVPLEIFRRQLIQQVAADFILAECRLVSLQTEGSKPVSNVHCRSLARPGRWSLAEHGPANPDLSRFG